MTEDNFVRPRLVLVTTLLPDGEAGQDMLRAALKAGDVASVIIEPAGRAEAAFQRFAEELVPLVQDAGAAAIVAEDTRCAGRVRADGFHTSTGDIAMLGEAVARFSPKLIVGASGFNTRHEAMEAGERLPDYIFFGKFGADRDPEPHKRNVELARWWAEIVEVPCILQGGASLDHLARAAETGAEFVALSAAIFAEPSGIGQAMEQANRIFDEVEKARGA
jgi:thiamine-phosphate pyrophosphorylase